MHIILKSHVEELAADFECEASLLAKKFEYFCNYCVVSKHYFGRFSPTVVTTGEDDGSLDGIAVIVDGDLITTEDDANEAFSTHKTNFQVDIVFTQVKSGDQFRKEEIANFKLGLDDFLSLDPKLPNGKVNTETIKVIKVVLANLKKVRNRRPNCHVYYCTSGVYVAQREIQAAFDVVEESLVNTEFFYSVHVKPLGRSEIIKLYAALSEKNEAKLPLLEYFGMPRMPGIPQSYVAIVKASDFVSALLEDADKNLRESIFEENVRSFLGNNNDVNSAIQQTLQSPEKRSLFSVLNNGITVVAPELTLTPNTKEIHLTNYQIINGCQTSSTLQANKLLLTDSVNVVIKFIESPENESSSDIIAATNSQSDIPKEAFFGLRSKAKLVQKYFIAQNNAVSQENRVHFERRQSEYKHSDYQSTRIFDVREVARCYAAMFLDLPHNSTRYVAKIFSASSDLLFKEDDHESYYYAACLSLYKYQTLINGKKFGAPEYTKARWHIIQVFKWLCHDTTDTPPPNSKKAEAFARKLIDVLNDDSKSYIKTFEKCQRIVSAVGMPTDDELKRARFGQDLLAETKKQLRKK